MDTKTGMALSIQQPWAWCIIQGHKLVENRTWKTGLRGWVGIHAGKTFDINGYSWICETFPHLVLPRPSGYQFGGIVGRARLVDCVTNRDGDPWFFGPHGLIFDRVEPLPFTPCRGQLGFFIPKAVAA